MLAAAARIERFTQGVTFESLRADEMRMSAVQRELITLGEAASQLTNIPEISQLYPSVPLTEIKAMRNVLVHEYWKDHEEIIWGMIEDLPTLISPLKQKE